MEAMIPIKGNNNLASMGALLRNKLIVDWGQLQTKTPDAAGSVDASKISKKILTTTTKEDQSKDKSKVNSKDVSKNKSNSGNKRDDGVRKNEIKTSVSQNEHFSGSLFLSSPDPSQIPLPNFDKDSDEFAGNVKCYVPIEQAVVPISNSTQTQNDKSGNSKKKTSLTHTQTNINIRNNNSDKKPVQQHFAVPVKPQPKVNAKKSSSKKHMVPTSILKRKV